MAGLARRLAEFTASLDYAALPETVRSRTRELCLHFLAVTARATLTRSSRLVRRAARRLSGPGPATVVGEEVRLAPEYAALANGATGHAIELDDVTEESSLHPGVVVFPAALAMAEARDAYPRALVAAVVAGYEVMGRLGSALDIRAHYARGFHPTATCGTFGAAAVAAHLMALDPERTAHALGVAGSMAAGSMQYLDSGALIKRTHPGLAAHSGIVAAHLAAEGITGPVGVIEGEQGFLRAYADGGDPGRVLAGLGAEWEVLKTAVKPHASCRHNHAAIDALLEIVTRHDLAPTDVMAITAYIPVTAMPIVAEPAAAKRMPANEVDAQFSLPYALAVAVRHRRVFPAEYADAVRADPEIRRLMGLVECRGDSGLEALFPASWPARIEVRASGGHRYEATVLDPRGSPKNPLGWKGLCAQTRALLEGVLPRADVEALIGAAAGLDALPDVASLLKPLTGLVGGRQAAP